MPQRLNRRAFLSALGAGGLSILLPRGFARAGEKPPVAGALLLAKIRTPPFRDSVVLLFEHGPQGTEGLIVNKAGHRSLGRIMARMKIQFRDRATFDRYAESEVLYGGPVGRGGLLSLIHTPPGKWPRSWNLGVVGITQTADVLRDIGAGTAGVRQVVACLGVSGWAPGQLRAEIAAGHWQVIYPEPEALPELLFDTPLCDRLERARTLPRGLPVGIPGQTI
ncbi:MAG: YqgE/AlgH family protein [Candidatus Methylomirabilales bacterium]